MAFLTPAFFAAAVALGLPIYIHLLKRHKTTPTPFSSLMFFERRTQSSVKHRRLQYLLLFALRMLLLTLLILAFAKPYMRSTTIASAAGNRSIVIALDQSFSMRDANRFETAKAEARKFLDSLRGSDRVRSSPSPPKRTS